MANAQTTESGLLLGIDVGGTAIKAGLFTLEGELLDQQTTPTPALVDGEAFDVVTDSLKALVTDNAHTLEEVVGVGLDIPGPIREDGTPGFLPNIKLDLAGLENAIKGAFANASLVALNDANAATFGELWRGSAQGERSFILVTLGTGVGGGVVCDGKLVPGKHGAGGEIGHMTVNKDESLVCGCGRKGCLEQYASATGLVRLYKAACRMHGTEPVVLSGPSDSYAVFQALEEGDAAAKEAVSQMCEYLAIAFAQMSCIVDPGAFVLGGGVSGSFDVFKDELVERFQAHALPMCADTKIIAASLGNKAGIYGSAYQALLVSRE